MAEQVTGSQSGFGSIITPPSKSGLGIRMSTLKFFHPSNPCGPLHQHHYAASPSGLTSSYIIWYAETPWQDDNELSGRSRSYTSSSASTTSRSTPYTFPSFHTASLQGSATPSARTASFTVQPPQFRIIGCHPCCLRRSTTPFPLLDDQHLPPPLSPGDTNTPTHTGLPGLPPQTPK